MGGAMKSPLFRLSTAASCVHVEKNALQKEITVWVQDVNCPCSEVKIAMTVHRRRNQGGRVGHGPPDFKIYTFAPPPPDFKTRN